jgi:hypothetical protein
VPEPPSICAPFPVGWLAVEDASDQVHLTRPVLLPSSLSIADAGALTELRVLAREERDDWLEQQRASYEQLSARTATRLSPRCACSPTKDASCSPTGHQPAGRCSSQA